MSGDVQPRKRKEKRKRKDEEEILHHHGSIGGSDEVIHVHKENKLGGNIYAKIVFFGLLAALGAMVGLIIIEYHGANDVDVQSPSNSPWSVMLEGWIDDSVGHDGHDDEEHQLHEEEDHDEHDDHEEHDHEEHDNDEEDDNEDDDSIEDEDDQFDEEDEDYDNEEHEEDDEDDGDEEDEEYDEEEEDEVEDDIDDDEEDDVEDDEEDDIEDDIDDDEEDDDDDDEGDDVEDDDDDEEEEEDGVEDDDNNDEEDDDDNDEEDNDDDDDEEEEEEEEEDDDEEEDEDDTENEEDGEVDVEEEEQEVEDSEEEEGEEDDKDMKNHNDRKKNWINKGGNKRKKQEDNNHDDSEISDDDNDDQFRVNYKTSRINNILGSGKSKKKESQDVTSNPKLKYIYKIMEKLKKQDKHLESKKFGTKTFETIGSKDDDEINQVGLEDEDVTPENGLDNDDEQEKTLADEKLSNEEEDETSGERSLLTEADTVPESAEVPPLFIERRQTLIPAEVMEDTPAIFVSQEGNYSKDQHEDEGEEEEVDDAAFVKETYEDLRAAYSQITPQESETEINEEDISLKSNDYATSESEPEPSESDDNEEEEEEEPTQPNDPLGQWKSDSGPELLAEEVEVVQTESETEEESEDETSSPEHPSSEGPKSVDDTYSKSDITNEADWEIKDELDDADRELDDGNLTSALSKFIALVTSYPHSPRAHYGKAKALDMLAEAQQNNNLLTQAITTYRAALNISQMPDKLLSIIGHRIIDRMRFKGLYIHAVEVHNLLIEKFSDNITHRIDLAVTYLMINSCVSG